MKLQFSLGVIISILAVAVWLSLNRIQSLKEDNQAKQQSIEALKDINKQLSDTTQKQAVEVRALTLTKQEFKDYKHDAEKKLSSMNVAIKNLKAAGTHSMELKIPVKGKIDINETPETDDNEYHRQDSIPRTPQKPFSATINIANPFLKVTGSVVADSIDINISTDVDLDQAISVIPKHKFLFWSWGVKGVKQTIRTDNPYVNIRYSEFIFIK